MFEARSVPGQDGVVAISIRNVSDGQAGYLFPGELDPDRAFVRGSDGLPAKFTAKGKELYGVPREPNVMLPGSQEWKLMQPGESVGILYPLGSYFEISRPGR